MSQRVIDEPGFSIYADNVVDFDNKPAYMVWYGIAYSEWDIPSLTESWRMWW